MLRNNWLLKFLFPLKSIRFLISVLVTFTSVCKVCSPGSSLSVWHLAFSSSVYISRCVVLHCLQPHSYFSWICGVIFSKSFHCVLSKNQTKGIYVSISKASFLYYDCKLLNLFQINGLSQLVLLHLCCHTNSFFQICFCSMLPHILYKGLYLHGFKSYVKIKLFLIF